MGRKLFSKCYSEFLIDNIRLEFGKLFSGIQMNMVLKNSCSPMFYKLDFLKRCKEFIWKHLRSITVIKKRLQSRCFPVNFAKFLKTPFFKEHLWTIASGFFHSLNCFLPPSEPIESGFPIFEHVLSRHSNVMNIINLDLENFTFQNKWPSCCCISTHISLRHLVELSGVF